jgi:hypothetical protein
MAFGDLINCQTSLTGKYHECDHRLEQYAVTGHPQDA